MLKVISLIGIFCTIFVIRVFRTIFLKLTQKRELASSTSEASIASEPGKRSLRKSSKPSMELRHLSAVFASRAQSEQINQIKHVSCERSELRQPSAVFANQLKQASQSLSTLVKRANQASYARLNSRLRLPSHTGREEGMKEGSTFRCFKPPKNWICIS